MAKDPAFLFYPGDWLGGTMLMTRHEKGCYIDLLMAQFNKFDKEVNHLTEEEIRLILGVDYRIWEAKLKPKFQTDSRGNFFNLKMENEIIRRRNYVKSRGHGKKSKSYDTRTRNHTEDRDGNENRIGNEIQGGAGGLPDFSNSPPSQAQVEDAFAEHGLSREEGADFYQWVKGRHGWDKINSWTDYTATVIVKKLKEKQNEKSSGNSKSGNIAGNKRASLDGLENLAKRIIQESSGGNS